MKVDITSIINTLKDLQQATQRVGQAYRCDWTDAVHASYKSYVDICNASSQEISQSVTQLNTICGQLSQIDSTTLETSIETVCNRANEV